MNDIKKYIDANFIIITTIAVISFCKVINYCYPIPSISEVLIVSEKVDMFLYDICTGYIISYIFYIIVYFVPEIRRKNKEEQDLIPLKLIIYREIQLELDNILSILSRIIAMGGSNKDGYNNIYDFLDYNNLVYSLQKIKLSDNSGTIDLSGSKNSFKDYLYFKCRKIQDNGSNILQRYKNNLSNELNYDIFYLVNECPLFSGFTNNYKLSNCTIFFDDNFPLSAYCPGYKEKLNKTVNHIINIYNWAEIEYDYLTSNSNRTLVEIYKVDYKSYVAKNK